jgi:iron complex outermembrane receptor protein/vitamin B12 transporter
MSIAANTGRSALRCGLLAAAFISANLTQAQQAPTTIHGVVRDPLGALVIGATVNAIEGKTIAATTTTGLDGRFHLSLDHSGRYALQIGAATFETTRQPPAYYKGASNAEVEVTLATQTYTQQVTVTATGTPTPEAQLGASVTVLPADDYRLSLEVQEPLRELPGVQMTQVGQAGGSSGLSIRGGMTDYNKVLIDGVPANSIGGGVEFANLANVGVDSIEVLREPNSALYGSDALAGVVSLKTSRGTTQLPLITYAGDAGNFHSYRNEVTAGTAYKSFDLYSALARTNTDNNIPNSEFHDLTYAGNFGYKLDAAHDLRFTVRHIAVSGGQPSAILLYGIPDDGLEQEHDNYYNAVWNGQATTRWHNQIRYGGLRQNGVFTEFGATGIPDPVNIGTYDGAAVTLVGANGYSVGGQAQFQYSSSLSQSTSTTNRDFVFAQTDYRVTSHLLALGAFKYENESGSSVSNGYALSSVQRGNYSYTLQFSGDLFNRLFYTAGTGFEKNGLFGFAATPRTSLAYYLFRPSGGQIFSGTKLHGTFSKGIKEPSLFQQDNSLYGALASQSGGAASIAQYAVAPLGPVSSRTFDGGVDQELLSSRARLGITYFHDEFTNGVEYVPNTGLLELGIAAANLAQFQYGAYINSLSFRTQGVEFESEYKLAQHLFARAGYTYTDAVVQHSFSSDNLGPSFNTASNFSTIPIGQYSPLVGARPFRIAPHTGYFSLSYTKPRFYASLTGTLVGSRDDSDFLTDTSYGTSLLLPNRNLDGAYQRLALGGGYQVTPRVNLYSNIENLLSEHYQEAFGYPALPFTFRSGIKFNFGGESWKLN